jgi:hypothetical protein
MPQGESQSVKVNNKHGANIGPLYQSGKSRVNVA